MKVMTVIFSFVFMKRNEREFEGIEGENFQFRENMEKILWHYSREAV